MLAISLVLIVVGALLLVLVHPADRGSAQLVKLGGGALIVAGVVLLVLFLAGVFDAADNSEVDAGVVAVVIPRAVVTRRVYAASRARGWGRLRAARWALGAWQRHPHGITVGTQRIA